jgi:uncharacterized coiled-coil protein SlyX
MGSIARSFTENEKIVTDIQKRIVKIDQRWDKFERTMKILLDEMQRDREDARKDRQSMSHLFQAEAKNEHSIKELNLRIVKVEQKIK